MPHRRLPNTIASVIRTLITARDQYIATATPSERAITAEQFAKLDPCNPASLLNRIIKESSDVEIALAAQAPLSSALAQIAARATLFASHFNQVLDLGIIRGTFAAGARAYYGRGIHDTAIPDLSTYAAVQTALDHIVRGEAQRLAAEGSGYVPMALPSAGECGTIFSQFLSALRNNSDAQQNTDTQREQLQALYTEAQALAVDICDTVEFHYRHDRDPGSFRTKCRRWGVVYIYDDNEPRDPDDTTGPGTGGLPPITPPPPSP